MKNGLAIRVEEFKGLKKLDREIVMFENIVYLKSKVSDYMFHKKLIYVWLSILTAALGFKKYLGF